MVTRAGGLIAAAGTILLLAACERQPETAPEPRSAPDAEPAAAPEPEGTADAAAVPERAAQAPESLGIPPHIYMALQPDGDRPLSIVFAIDDARNGNPNDDSAVRLTPMDGDCNPQDLGFFNFARAGVTTPTYGPDEAAEGITARDLPAFMAIAVSSAMMARGLAVEPEETKPQNVCTRKLWELLVLTQTSVQR